MKKGGNKSYTLYPRAPYPSYNIILFDFIRAMHGWRLVESGGFIGNKSPHCIDWKLIKVWNGGEGRGKIGK